MKNTKIKILCSIFLLLMSMNIYSQLIPPSHVGDDGTGKCWDVDGDLIICAPFEIPASLLTYDYTVEDEFGCHPVNNFGCDLHVGLTFSEDVPTSYVSVTDCSIQQMIKANEIDPVTGKINGVFPTVCLIFPMQIDFCDATLEFSIDLYCKDASGDFTPVSEVGRADLDNNWSIVFPGDEPKSIIEAESFSKFICCLEEEPGSVQASQEEHTPLAPIIGQNDDGSTAFVRNLKDITQVSVSMIDANYQIIDLSNRLSLLSNSEYSIDISNLNQGVYYIRVAENGAIYSKAIVKL